MTIIIRKDFLPIVLIGVSTVVITLNAEAACTAQETQLIQQVLQQAQTQTFEAGLQSGQWLASQLSSGCYAQLQQYLLNQLQPSQGSSNYPTTQPYQYPGGGYYMPQTPSVYDHGYGTYSTSEGACGPSGCLSY